MGLRPPAPRESIHERRIECRGYRQSDGLWDIEGHLVLATTAYQTVHVWRARHQPTLETDRPPRHLDTCHALARDGEVVREHSPRWSTGRAGGSDG